MVAMIVALLAGLFGAGAATAKPRPAPGIAFGGNDLVTLGDNSFCRGTIKVVVLTDPAKRGQATFRLTPQAMIGDGPGWRKNPVCKVPVQIVWYDAILPVYHQVRGLVVGGPRPGKPVDIKIRASSGLILAGVASVYANKPVSYYPIIP